MREILDKIKDHFGFPEDIFDDYEFWELKKGEIWICSKVGGVDIQLPFHRRGIKFASFFSKGGFRLTTAAAQIFGGKATRNFVELNEKERESFIRGLDIKNRWHEIRGQIIVRYNGFPLGVAVLTKDNVIKNQVPAARRIRA